MKSTFFNYLLKSGTLCFHGQVLYCSLSKLFFTLHGEEDELKEDSNWKICTSSSESKRWNTIQRQCRAFLKAEFWDRVVRYLSMKTKDSALKSIESWWKIVISQMYLMHFHLTYKPQIKTSCHPLTSLTISCLAVKTTSLAELKPRPYSQTCSFKF